MSKNSSLSNFIMFLFSFATIFSFITVLFVAKSGQKPNLDNLRKAYSGLGLNEDTEE